MSARTPGEIHAEIEAVRLRCYVDLAAAPDEHAECLVWTDRYDRTAELWRELHLAVASDPGTPMWAVTAAGEMEYANRAYAAQWRDTARRRAELDAGGVR